MRGVYQFAQLRKGSEMILNGVKVLWVVTMKTCAWFAFLQLNLIRMIVVVIPGRKPERCDTKILQIGEAVDNALKITAVIIEFVVAVVDTARFLRVIVCEIAIAETVDHYQIQDVSR